MVWNYTHVVKQKSTTNKAFLDQLPNELLTLGETAKTVTNT